MEDGCRRCGGPKPVVRYAYYSQECAGRIRVNAPTAPHDIPAQRARLAAIAALAPRDPNGDDPRCSLEYRELGGEGAWHARIDRSFRGYFEAVGKHPDSPALAVDAARNQVRAMVAELRVKAAEHVEQFDEAMRKLEGL